MISTAPLFLVEEVEPVSSLKLAWRTPEPTSRDVEPLMRGCFHPLLDGLLEGLLDAVLKAEVGEMVVVVVAVGRVDSARPDTVIADASPVPVRGGVEAEPGEFAG